MTPRKGDSGFVPSVENHGLDFFGNGKKVPALMTAVVTDDADMVTELIKVHFHDVDAVAGLYGITAACFAAMKGRDACLSRLVLAGADLEKADKDGETPAFWASRNNHPGCLAILREAGCNLGKKNAAGYTGVYWAAFGGYEGCLRLLIESKVDAAGQCGPRCETPMEAAEKNNFDECAAMLRKYTKPARKPMGKIRLTPHERDVLSRKSHHQEPRR
jgi:ankyrin repeat protein